MSLSPAEFKILFPDVCANIHGDEIQSLLENLRERKLGAGELLIEDGAPSHSLYFVIQGSLLAFLLQNDQFIEVGNIGPGQYVGEISFIDGGVATTSVKAVSPCVLLELTQEAYLILGNDYPRMVSNMMRSISNLVIKRLCDTDILLFDGLTGLTGKEPAAAALTPRNPFQTFLESMYRH